MLSSTCYEGSTIIVEQEQTIAINDEVSSKIINKIASGLQISKLERIIMDVAILTAGGYQIDGKVNSASDFNENSFEKTQENVRILDNIDKPGFSLYQDRKSDLLRNLLKNQPIKFTREIVENVYNSLSFEEKYYIDEDGNIWRPDPIGVVRNALESSGYKLDGYWYSWGTKPPSKVDVGNIKLDTWRSSRFFTDERFQWLEELEGQMIEERDNEGRLYRMPVLFNKDNIIGIVKKHGTDKIFWLELGLYNPETESGVGMQKIFGKHFENQFKDWGKDWNTPEKIADNFLEILETQKEIDYQYTIEDGHTYLYQLKIEGEIKYLLIGVGTNGFILTAHPYGKNQL